MMQFTSIESFKDSRPQNVWQVQTVVFTQFLQKFFAWMILKRLCTIPRSTLLTLTFGFPLSLILASNPPVNTIWWNPKTGFKCKCPGVVLIQNWLTDGNSMKKSGQGVWCTFCAKMPKCLYCWQQKDQQNALIINTENGYEKIFEIKKALRSLAKRSNMRIFALYDGCRLPTPSKMK